MDSWNQQVVICSGAVKNRVRLSYLYGSLYTNRCLSYLFGTLYTKFLWIIRAAFKMFVIYSLSLGGGGTCVTVVQAISYYFLYYCYFSHSRLDYCNPFKVLTQVTQLSFQIRSQLWCSRRYETFITLFPFVNLLVGSNNMIKLKVIEFYILVR